MIVPLVEERDGRGEEVVEDAVRLVVCGFNVGDAAVAVDLQVRDVALRTAYSLKLSPAMPRDLVLSVGRGLEVVEKVKLFVVDEARWQRRRRQGRCASRRSAALRWRLASRRAPYPKESRSDRRHAPPSTPGQLP